MSTTGSVLRRVRAPLWSCGSARSSPHGRCPLPVRVTIRKPRSRKTRLKIVATVWTPALSHSSRTRMDGACLWPSGRRPSLRCCWPASGPGRSRSVLGCSGTTGVDPGSICGRSRSCVWISAMLGQVSHPQPVTQQTSTINHRCQRLMRRMAPALLTSPHSYLYPSRFCALHGLPSSGARHLNLYQLLRSWHQADRL
jgi:hypothetical protein